MPLDKESHNEEIHWLRNNVTYIVDMCYIHCRYICVQFFLPWTAKVDKLVKQMNLLFIYVNAVLIIKEDLSTV